MMFSVAPSAAHCHKCADMLESDTVECTLCTWNIGELIGGARDKESATRMPCANRQGCVAGTDAASYHR